MRAGSFLVVKEAALISVEGQMVSLARAKTPFPARAAELSKRAAIIDVPSLAPPRFSLPRQDPSDSESRSKFVTATRRLRALRTRRTEIFRGAEEPLLTTTATPFGGGEGERKNAISLGYAARVTTVARARES